jgi:NAD(P)-dependent dehydrogenase (short-subunit alcohol dehydrogenase family)
MVAYLVEGDHQMPTAVITGASQGLGRAVALALAERGWELIVDARGADRLAQAAAELEAAGAKSVTAIAGDVADPGHRRALGAAADAKGGVDLLMNNASTLGVSPQPAVAEFPADALLGVYAVNTVAPLALVQTLADALRESAGVIVNVSSDAAVEPYEGWGGYGSSKAALDHATAILAVEEPALSVYALDPGDMRTQLHQDAFPGEDISDRPEPETAVPAVLRLVDERPPSGRYRAAELLAGDR